MLNILFYVYIMFHNVKKNFIKIKQKRIKNVQEKNVREKLEEEKQDLCDKEEITSA